MKIRRKIHDKIIKSTLILVGLVFVGLVSSRYITSQAKDSFNSAIENSKIISSGVELIKKLEFKDVIEVEKKIDDMNKKKDNVNKKKDIKDKDLKQIFENSVIMGDSISESLIEYNILNKSSVVAYKGRNTSTAKKDVNLAVNLYPSNIFMAYGMNDIPYFRGDANKFILSYEKLIQDLKSKLPKSKIYICSILPVQQKVIDEDKFYYKLDEFNNALKDMCNRLGLTFIESKDIVVKNPNLFEKDGVHMKIGFYPLWLRVLLDKSNL